MVFTRKFSEFNPEADLDEVVGLESGANARAPDGGGGGGGSGEAIEKLINQVAHGLYVGDWVLFNGVEYIVSQSNSAMNAEAVGVVKNVNTPDSFTLQQIGFIEDLDDPTRPGGITPYLPLVPGQVYFLSQTVAGSLQLADVTTIDHVSKPCLLATTTTGGWVYHYRGQIQGNEGGSGGGGGGGGADGSTQVVITQPGHTFAVNDWVRVDTGTTFALAQSDTFDNSQVVGMVVETPVDGDADKFIIQTSGFTNQANGLTAATLHYLSSTVPGLAVNAQPTGAEVYSKPLIFAFSANSGFILPVRPLPVSDADNSNFIRANQVGGFAVNKVLRTAGAGIYAEAQADSLVNSRNVVGVVIYSSGDDFIIQTGGYTNKLTGLTTNAMHYLSEAIAGDLTTLEPAAVGEVSKPMVIGLTPTSGYIVNQRPMEQPGANGGGGGGGGGWVHLATATAANSATVDFTAAIDGTYDMYVVKVNYLLTATNATTLWMRLRSGGVFRSTAGDYGWGWTSLLAGNSSNSDAQIQACPPGYLSNIATKGLSGLFYLSNPSSTTQHKLVFGQGSFSAWGATIGYNLSTGGILNAVTTAVDGIRFMVSSGNIAIGKFDLYGINN